MEIAIPPAEPRDQQREMARRIAAFDWAGTALGSMEFWPATLRHMVDVVLASPVAMVVLWGSDGCMLYNDGYIPIAGARHPATLGGTAREIWPEIWPWNRDVLDHAFRGEALTFRDQEMVVRRNGLAETVWFDLFYTPLKDDAGTYAGALCTVIETTGQVAASRRAEESDSLLALAQSRLGLLLNQTSIGIIQSDLSDRIVTVNERFASIVGREADRLAGDAFDLLIHPDDREADRALRDSLLATGQAFAAEKRLLRPDGSVVWVSHHVSAARDRNHQPEFLVHIVQDVSDRKDAEALARESSERIELALGAGIILGSWVWDVRDDRVVGDARFAASFSLRPEDARLGVPIARTLSAIHPDDRAVLNDTISTCMRDGGPFRAEYRLRRSDGQWIWVEANGHCERDAEGNPVRFPGVLINIGHRHDSAERQAFHIALGDQLRTLDQPNTIMERTVAAAARHLQAPVVAYGEASPDGQWIDLLAATNGDGATEVGRVATDAIGSDAGERIRAGEASLQARVPEILLPKTGAALGSMLAVPLFREGRWHAVMFAVAQAGRNWSDHDVDLVREVVGRTWDAVERARAVVTLRKAQARQAFLLRLNDHLSELHEPSEVVETVAASLGAFLGVNRAAHAEVLAEDAALLVGRDWTDGSVQSLTGLFPYKGVLDDDMAQLTRGLTVSEDDFSMRLGRPALLDAALERSGTRAALAVPLIRDGRLRAALLLAQTTPRHWSLEEISLTQEVARRTWDALERTRAEEALQRSEARLRAMFDTLPVGIVFAEMPSGRVTEGNARVEQILGSSMTPSSSDVNYADWVAFDEDGTRVPIQEHPLFVAITTGEMATHVFHHQRGDGSRVWISVIGAPVRDTEGRVTGGLVTIVDIDREKRAEAALRELNATLEHQVEARTRERDRIWRNSRDLLAAMGIDGTLHAFNPSWTALLGWPAEDLIGHRFTRFIHPDEADSTAAAIASLERGPLSAPFENRLQTREGGDRWFSWTATFDGDTVYANGRDITAEKEQAQALRLAEEQLRQSQKMEAVGQLTGGIAHDFNNLLTGITGALDLLAKRIEQGRLDNVSRYIGMAMNSANRAASLTHRLLAFSRRQPLEARPVNANRLVKSMDDLLRRTLGERVTLEIAVAKDVSITLCDPHQLENALLNLVINARDAMPDGGRLTIETANASLESPVAARDAGVRPGIYVMVSVSDTGTGMTADVIDRAFDPFFTTKPIGQGTGLGLSMIYGFAKQSEGTVKIRSDVGAGTTVTLYLPRFLGEVQEAGEMHLEPPRALDGETVLVVEDDGTVRRLVLEVLRDLGYRTLEAEDGPSGLRTLESGEHIDLLVTDVGLPGLNGRQLADRARQLRPDLRILFITGYAENATFGGVNLDPGMQMITKPFAVDVLATKIKEMLETARPIVAD